MKSVLISIRPEWVEKILKGEKTIEVRKSRPKIETPFKCYIYCTKAKSQWLSNYEGAYENSTGEIVYAQQHIIGEFLCDKVYNLVNAFGGIMFADENLNQLEPQLFRDMSCLTDEQTEEYLGNKDGYGWHISDLKIYDKTKELSKFKISCNRKNLCYSCNRFTGKPWDICNNTITCPPKSWCYVDEV